MWNHQSPLPLMEATYLLDPPQNRWPGIHVTDIIKHLNPRKYQDDGDDSMMAMGRMWEVVARGWVARECNKMGFLLAPSVQCQESDSGLIGNLDGIIAYNHPSPVHAAVFEAKFTTKSKADVENEWTWMTQVKAYCHLIGVGCCWLAVLRVPRTGKPRAEATLNILTFTQDEIEENWRMLMNGLADMKERGLVAV